MNALEIFNTVKTHLLQQNSQSLLENPNRKVCAYRGTEGRMCAVGCLIKDEYYDSGLERKRVRHPDVRKALGSSGISIDDIMTRDLLFDLQAVHDTIPVSHWEVALNDVKERYFK